MDKSSSGTNSMSEIETKTKKTYGPEDVMRVQMAFFDTISQMACKQLASHEKCVNLAEQLFFEHNNLKNRFANEFKVFLTHHEYTLCKHVMDIEKRADEFGKGLEEMMELYVDVNDLMKAEQKNTTDHEIFVAQVEKNTQQFKDTKSNLEKLKNQLSSVIPPISSTSSLSSSDVSESFVKANTLTQPFKPIESEVATHTTRIVNEIYGLRERLEMCKNVKKLTDPIIAQSKLVAEKVLKEFPDRSVKAFIETLPPEHRD